MNFRKAEFITSAPSIRECPEESLPEFCFAGRSNVGKSTLINKITDKKKLARTSNTPGKTQQMNYYNIDDEVYIVDLPGFGFAKVPKKERDRWGKDIKQYLLMRKPLKLIFHLVDSRHNPTGLDQEFFYWMASKQKPFAILLTKADKISKNKLSQAEKKVNDILSEMNIEVPVIPCSGDTGKGVQEIQSLITEFKDYDYTE